LLRWAAAAAVVAAAVLMTHRQMNQATAAPDLAAAQPPPPPADVPLLVADGAPPPVPATTPGDAIGAGAPENGGTGTGVAGHAPVTSSRIMRVAADPAAAGATDTRQALLVPPRVRHVWVVNDVNAAKRTVLDSLPKDASVTVATSEDGTVAIQAVLPDRALQGLVDTLAEAGMSLLSPTAPQPNRAKNLIVTGRMVRYDMDLVHGP
jgi:hypothetical protein